MAQTYMEASQTLVGQINIAIEQEFARVAEPIILQATKDLETALRQVVAKVVLTTAQHYSVSRRGDDVRIEVIFPGGESHG